MTTQPTRFAPQAGPYRWAGVAVLITLAAHAPTIHAATAHAAAAHASQSPSPKVIGHCRTDPVVLLSDGTRLTVTATIADTARDVRAVAYAIHVPAGTSLARLSFPSDGLKVRETVHVYADNQPATYGVATIVNTGATTQAVVQMRVIIPDGRQAVATSGGAAHQMISTRVTMVSPHAPAPAPASSRTLIITS